MRISLFILFFFFFKNFHCKKILCYKTVASLYTRIEKNGGYLRSKLLFAQTLHENNPILIEFSRRDTLTTIQ